MSATVTYRKTKAGQWVAYGPASSIREGHYVTVSKRDGTTQVELVERVGRSFTVDGTEMVYGYIDREGRPSTARRADRPTRQLCAECGRGSKYGPMVECLDSSGLVGLCCPTCARASRFERSFA